MNKQILKGYIRDIKPSHSVNDIDYDQSDIIVTRGDGKEDILSLKFKKFSNRYSEGDYVELLGNVRSYSRKLDNGKNKVDIYVFTYFDIPDSDDVNLTELDGRICRIDTLRKTLDGKYTIHLTLANNMLLENSNQKINSYIPCIAWGKNAMELAKLRVNDIISIKGELHSRQYKKIIDKDEFEFRVAHECLIKEFEVIEE